MRVSASFLICFIAVCRCVILHSSNPYFDLDPSVTGELATGVLGPSSSVLLDLIVLSLCSIALLGEAIRGRRIYWCFVSLAAIPIVAIWFHGRTDPMQYLHGSAWSAAIMACVTLAHLCRGQRVSLITPIVLLSLTIPLLANAAFSYGEHLQLVRYFDQNTQEVLGMRGLKPGSIQAAVFEERLRSYGPMGWFTTPNVFGGVFVSLGVVWAFVAVALLRGKRNLYCCITSLLAILCGAAAISTLSKAAVVLVILAALLSAMLWVSKLQDFLKRWGGWIALSIVLFSLYVVFFRGCLAESAFGDRSLLVRSQYFTGGLETAGMHPLLGVGPNQIQDAWLGVRPENATEAIVSTHNIVIDWLASYGIISFCWIAILARLLWNAGSTLWIDDRTNRRQCISAGLGIAAIVLVVDAQIDLPMFDTGSTLFAFCLLGIAGVVKHDPVLRIRPIDRFASIIPLFMASVIYFFGYSPLARDEYLQRNAAASIIANEPFEEVAAVLANQSVTVQSKLTAAKLFMSAGNNKGAIETLMNVVPHSGVWFIRSKAAQTPEDAVVAAKKLVEIDPNGLQAALVLADSLWANNEKDKARTAYYRVLDLNESYQVEPFRALPRSRVKLIDLRIEKSR